MTQHGLAYDRMAMLLTSVFDYLAWSSFWAVETWSTQ